MRILVAPDKFKGTLRASQAAGAIKRGVLQAAEQQGLPAPEIILQPIGDGGEGTMQLLCESLPDCAAIKARAPDSLGAHRDCEFYESGDAGSKKAYIEMASINGLALLDPARRDPEHSLSTGTGELIVQAIRRGAVEIYVGLGGSATVDCGAGALEALGFRFQDANQKPVYLHNQLFSEANTTGSTLADALIRIDSVSMPAPVKAKLFAVVDVNSPLNGPEGAIACFALQKGLPYARQAPYSRALEHFSKVCEQARGTRPGELSMIPGTGAAGGLGFALAVAGATILPGFDFFSKSVKLREKMDVDLVITGEGKMDSTSLSGKGPGGLARMAKETGVPCIAICGKVEDRDSLMDSGLFSRIYEIGAGLTEKESMARADELLEPAAARAIREFQSMV